MNFSNGEFDHITLEEPYSHVARDLLGIKDSVKNYQGEEKVGVHHISIKNLNVIDVEIQFPGEGKRIDFAALQRVGNEIRIVFFEAKAFSNKEIHSPIEMPSAINQIKSY